MGNSAACRSNPSAIFKVGRLRGPVEQHCKSEICGSVAGDVVTQALAAEETEEFFSRTRDGHHLLHISDWEMPQGKEMVEVGTPFCPQVKPSPSETPGQWVDLGSFLPGAGFLGAGHLWQGFQSDSSLLSHAYSFLVL